MKFYYLVVLLLFTACQFSISEKKLEKKFEGKTLKPEQLQIVVGERRMHYAYLESGHESLVVFIHGSPGSWNAFIDFFQVDSLLESVDMLSVDRPGFGNSDSGWPEPKLAAQSRLIHEIIKRHPHEKVILVGHSLGGPVIARMAMDFPDSYDGLLFVAPSIDPEMEKKEWYRSWIKTKFGGWLTPKDFWVSNEEIVPLKQELTDMLPLWDRIKAKSIVIQGKKDMLVPWQNAEFAKKMLPEALIEVRYLEKVNHFIPWSNPETITQAILDLNS